MRLDLGDRLEKARNGRYSSFSHDRFSGEILDREFGEKIIAPTCKQLLTAYIGS
jgi:hypothetical protein